MNELEKTDSARQKKACGLCCTRIENFSVKIGNHVVLNNINLHIHCGNLTALIGPNGAGKSTLLKAILGDVQHEGRMKFLDNKNVHTNNPLIGYVPQYLNFDKDSPITVMDLFTASTTTTPVWLFHPANIRKEALVSLAKAGAEHLADRMLGQLSGGELQRVLLALAIHPVPDLLLLDEPVSGVDQKGMAQFYDLVSEIRKQYDLSIILVSHDLELVARYADRVVFLNGTIEASGTPEEVYAHLRFREIFGENWHRDLMKNQNNPGGHS